jgi:hypothetical protein
VLPAVVEQSSPAVKSSESPGRKIPMSRPVSANKTTNMPIAPKFESRLWGLRRFTANNCDECMAVLTAFTFPKSIDSSTLGRPVSYLLRLL